MLPTLPVESRVPQETLRRYALPVDTLTVRSFWQVTSETCTAPVVTVRFSASAEVCSARMPPVVVWMLSAPETAAQKTAFPVLEVISARSNVNASGSSMAPVLPVTVRVRYCDSGR